MVSGGASENIYSETPMNQAPKNLVPIDRRQAVGLVAASMVTGGVALIAAPPQPPRDGIVRFGAARRYRVEHSVTFTNGDVELSSVELWVPVPQDLLEQSVTRLKTEPDVPVILDKTGQAAVAKLVLSDALPAPSETVSLKVSYQVTCRARLTSPQALARYPYREYPRDKQYETFLRPEKYVQVADDRIAELAGKFAGTCRPAPLIARDIYDYVIDHTQYKPVEGFGGAAYCLEKGHGECGDYCALFVALCRAAGVPARPVTGFWANESNGWHCWAEFMLPNGEWVPVDPQIGDRAPFRRNFCFGSMDNRRVALCKTLDVRLPESEDGHHELDLLQTGAWWWWSNRKDEEARLPQATFHVMGKPM
jgi:transglutaminase-like putative cysteine protease